MPRLDWLTDIHLNFLKGQAVYTFFDRVAASGADAVLLGGDIGESHDVAFYLTELAEAVQRPIYFVLGNHDFYRGSIGAVRAAAAKLTDTQPLLQWLPTAPGGGVVTLSPTDAARQPLDYGHAVRPVHQLRTQRQSTGSGPRVARRHRG